MKNGFIKTAAVAGDIKVADTVYNAENIIAKIKEAASTGAKLVVFPELCITGYTCGDLFFQKTLLDSALTALKSILKRTRGLDILCVVGLPVMHNMKLYNCAAVMHSGKLLALIPKTNISSDESRYFCAPPKDNEKIEIFDTKCPFGTKVIFSCSDLPWFSVGVEIGNDLYAQTQPSQAHTMAGATIIANLCANAHIIGRQEYTNLMVKAQSARLVCGYVCADAGNGESTTDMVFAGHNIICENGNILNESKLFETEIIHSEIDVDKLISERIKAADMYFDYTEGYEHIEFDMKLSKTKLTRTIEKRPFVPEDNKELKKRCAQILAIQSMGLKKRLEHSGSKKAVVGISGGLDSCLALLVMHKTMQLLKRDFSDIVAVTMPCFGTTKRTRSNAELLCEALGVTLETVDITKSVKQHFEDIGQSEDNYDVVYENSQARERTQVLMDIANRCGGLVVGTGDLSELALGWATYNGDHMSMYAVNASVPKTLVRHIVKYCADMTENEKLRKVLYDILDTPVSPELLPADKDGVIAQKTEDLVGPYDLHDFFLYYMVRFGFAPSKIYDMCAYAYDGEYSKKQILYWMKVFYRRFFSQQFKRSCLPDGPKTGSVTFSPRGDFKMPSDASSKLWLDEIDKLD
ncbi:MAG: NAD(+) synthase [Ruminococcaceae bacterium]|nr:NAD(+) synthase [Oscillospiraceae bacterium]